MSDEAVTSRTRTTGGCWRPGRAGCGNLDAPPPETGRRPGPPPTCAPPSEQAGDQDRRPVLDRERPDRALVPVRVPVRASKNPAGGVLVFRAAAWSRFVGNVRRTYS
ncbi:DUF397 domain-containing protein [Streptomyces sp. VNUA24]|uniref:DUF397 domain-containing protein n=1 Tax=Streptomyces sp. VNUA24 TaxID=3031131 RepID=UPI0023B82BCA|nr:DUF397 domain-containing protein [Streptomyces sp. VNUA24]WEH17174.1 DUF397 domain-containing protein [Streptomyces sp. VNUA24]